MQSIYTYIYVAPPTKLKFNENKTLETIAPHFYNHNMIFRLIWIQTDLLQSHVFNYNQYTMSIFFCVISKFFLKCLENISQFAEINVRYKRVHLLHGIRQIDIYKYIYIGKLNER